jgi:hypothetical protein
MWLRIGQRRLRRGKRIGTRRWRRVGIRIVASGIEASRHGMTSIQVRGEDEASVVP